MAIISTDIHLTKHDRFEITHHDGFTTLAMRSPTQGDATIYFEDREHLQNIITSLQEQLDEIKEKGE